MYLDFLNTILATSAIIQLAAGMCVSSGWDFVDGGQNYFINTLDPAPFSFGTIFNGCVPDDTDGLVTPVVIDPNEIEYFCSDIADTPDGAVQMSSCNVLGPAGPPLYKNNMISGTYIIVIQGLTFAWMRTFTIIAGPQMTITATPTAFFNVTLTPSTTTTSTYTTISNTTLIAITHNTTVPSTTITKFVMITPPAVTLSTTSVATKTEASVTINSKTWITTTETLTCSTQTPKKDPTCTLTLKRTLPSSTANTTVATSSRKGKDRKLYRPRIPDRRASLGGQRGEQWRRDLLAKRTADLPTTTVTETSYIVSIYSTFTAATSTELDLLYTTVTTTITPPPVTSTLISGKARTTTTITLKTPTKTKTVHSTTTRWTTRHNFATLTKVVWFTPHGLVCKAGATPTPT